MKKIKVSVLGAIILLLVASSPAYADEQDFILVNATGVIIDELYISPVDADDWQEDVLGVDVLEDGDEVQVNFSRDEEDCSWDLMVKDPDGTEVVWHNINLCEYSRITLHIEDGKVWATFE